MSTINLGGVGGGQRPGEDGQDGASIGGGIGGKGGKGGAARVVDSSEPDVGMMLAAVAAELRRTGQIDGNAQFEVEHDGVHFRVVEASE